MSNISDYVMSVAIGTRVSDITGKSGDGFSAGGYAAFVQSITGKPPTVIQLPDKRAKIILSQEQASLMQKWLDRQLSGALAKKTTPDTLILDMNPVLIPWALKYSIPIALFFVIAGWVGHWYVSR